MAFLWDWVLFFLWTAVFAWWHKLIPDQKALDETDPRVGKDAMRAFQSWYNISWVNLVLMLLFLITAIMGPVCLLRDRKSLFRSRVKV